MIDLWVNVLLMKISIDLNYLGWEAAVGLTIIKR